LYSVCGKVHENIPNDLPTPLGKDVVLLTHSVDANLYHDIITGHAVSGVLHFINDTVIDWYSERQVTVEAATYGSEFVATKLLIYV
jgi:hypothetical protein